MREKHQKYSSNELYNQELSQSSNFISFVKLSLIKDFLHTFNLEKRRKQYVMDYKDTVGQIVTEFSIDGEVIK